MNINGIWTPTFTGSVTSPGQDSYESGASGWRVESGGRVEFRGTITFCVDTMAYDRYPPRQPARGSTSRRREKLRKAGWGRR